MKRCTRCKELKSLDLFYRSKESKDLCRSSCKKCVNASHVVWVKKNSRRLEFRLVTPSKMRRCTRCKELKLSDLFYRSSGAKDGLTWYCKKCINDKTRAWAKKNPKRAIEFAKRWSKKYPEKKKAADKEWVKNHRESVCKSSREWGQRNKEHIRKNSRQWRQKFPEKAQQRVRNYRARKVKAEGSFTAQEWGALKERYTYTCLCCGRKEPEIKLSPDHVIPLVHGGSNRIDNIQPLCCRIVGNCQSTKGTKHTDFRGLYGMV